jgi:hypothetical protein
MTAINANGTGNQLPSVAGGVAPIDTTTNGAAVGGNPATAFNEEMSSPKAGFLPPIRKSLPFVSPSLP